MSGLGEVEIRLDGKKEVLRSTLGAARAINGMTGGFRSALDGLSRIDMNVYVAIIAAGLDRRTQEEIEKIEEAVYKTGVLTFDAPLTKFVTLMMNGGREPKKAGETEGAAPGKE